MPHSPTNPEHVAIKLTEARRLDYVAVIASMVYADGVVDPNERQLLVSLCSALNLGPAHAEQLLGAAGASGRPDARPLAAKFTDNYELRLSLLTDAIVMAFADGKVCDEEAEAIKAFAAVLDLTAAQAALIGRYVATVQGASPAMQAPTDSLFGRKLARGIGTGEVESVPDERQQGVIRWLMKMLRRK